ncbi:MAG: FHA domain-containing protein [Planctomycetes bacterium]|nr:FHA domain-containing protein [Planctomycetota bacterium]
MIRFQLDTRAQSEECVIDAALCVVGRADDCTVAFPELSDLSRHHFRLVLDGVSLRLEDLGSRHGTFVKGLRVGAAELQVGDEVRAGSLKLTVLEFFAIEETAVMPGQTRGGGLAENLDPTTFPNFRILRRLGAGGMGVVYAAEQVNPSAQRALKVLRPELAASDTALQEFVTEMLILASLDHAGIVKFYGHGHAQGFHYLLMELVDGESAREKLRREGPLPYRVVMQMAFEVAQALHGAWLHRHVVHGDIKPANVLLTKEGVAKLCDFGLAQMGRTDAADKRGTAAYSAPELFSGRAPRSVASDFYALGISLFQLLSGRLPYEQLEVTALRQAHEHQPLPDLSALLPDLPAAASALVARLCAKAPSQRHRNHDELLADLDLLR